MALAPGIIEDLSLLNALLDAQLHVFRRDLGDPYRGLYVSAEDVDEALAVAPALDASAEFVGVLERVRAAWSVGGGHSPLDELLRRLDLGPVERGLLLLGLAPEVDLRYQRIYAYLHDDIARKAPTVELASNLLSASADERLLCRRALAPDAPLRAFGLVDMQVPAADDQAQSPFLAHSFRLTNRAASFLLGDADGDQAPRLPAFVDLFEPSAPDSHLHWSALESSTCRAVASAVDPTIVQLVGDPLARRGIARALAGRLGVRLLLVDCRALLAGGGDPIAGLRRLRCERLIGGAVLCWDGFDAVLEADGAWRRELLAHLGAATGMELLGTAAPIAIPPVGRRDTLAVEIPPLTLRGREELWRAALAGCAREEPLDLTGLAARYPLEPGQIDAAARLAVARVQGRPIAIADVERACRESATPDFRELAQRVDTPYEWDDLVLPGDRLEVLREICAHARLRLPVDERWGFSRHGAAARGLAVLFSGPSGTGKTMSAGVVARTLGLDLYRVDLSRVVSKYIGETEKNLARVFDVTRGAPVCLLFDEADALFAKRSEVKDAHDRFANLETSYLLQRLEQHDGPVFLATNLRHNMDAAFLRRLHYLVHFVPPDEAQRRDLWRRIWPAETPLGPDVDPAALARAFALTGGHIRNIALAAAIRAYADARPVSMPDIIHATRREYEKLGKSTAGAEFGAFAADAELS